MFGVLLPPDRVFHAIHRRRERKVEMSKRQQLPDKVVSPMDSDAEVEALVALRQRIEVEHVKELEKRFNEGFDQGFEAGYWKGYDIRQNVEYAKRLAEKTRTEFDKGFEKGYEKGYDIGYDDGHADRQCEE